MLIVTALLKIKFDTNSEEPPIVFTSLPNYTTRATRLQQTSQITQLLFYRYTVHANIQFILLFSPLIGGGVPVALWLMQFLCKNQKLQSIIDDESLYFSFNHDLRYICGRSEGGPLYSISMPTNKIYPYKHIAPTTHLPIRTTWNFLFPISITLLSVENLDKSCRQKVHIKCCLYILIGRYQVGIRYLFTCMDIFYNVTDYVIIKYNTETF